jgi:hypothetical protein
MMRKGRLRAWLAERVAVRRRASEAMAPRLSWEDREAYTADYRPGAGLYAAMLGDSTVRDFAIASTPVMLWRQWFGNQRNPFLDRVDDDLDSIFERLARRGPTRVVEYACSGASVGPARTWSRRRFQWMANVKTLSDQIDELLRESPFPDLTLVWIGHNNLDFVTELPRFSRGGILDHATEGIALAFASAFRRDLARLVEGASHSGRRAAIVVYGLVNPDATREARDRARAIRAKDRRRYPYLEVAETRFPPLRPEHGDRLVALSRRLSAELARAVDDLRADGRVPARVQVSYSDTTAQVDFSRPELLSDEDAWHASYEGKVLLANALFDGLTPALTFLTPGGAPAPDVQPTRGDHG